jgi:hypothetical protein
MIRHIVVTGVVTITAIIGLAVLRNEPAPVPKPAPTQESFHSKNLTFAERWAPVKELWAYERSDKLLPGEKLIGPPIKVKTISIPMPPEPPPMDTITKTPAPSKIPFHVADARAAPLAPVVCERHGLRKRWVSKTKWRCVK